MADSNPLINLGELGKPATALIEKVSDAVGGICKPWQMKRIAKAEVEVEKIKSLGQIEVSDIQQRAIQRLFIDEGKKQENIEAITAEATKNLNQEADPGRMEEDWISHFFEKCKNISNKEMQTLWANLLAGEANHPGKFSRRTIDLVSTLDRNDAQLFTNLCSFSIDAGSKIPFIFSPEDKIYNDHGINFSTLSHLEYLGLLKFNDLAGFLLSLSEPCILVHYFNTPIVISTKENKDTKLQLQAGKIMLTASGLQLLTIAGATPVAGFLDYFVDELKKSGYEVILPATNK